MSRSKNIPKAGKRQGTPLQRVGVVGAVALTLCTSAWATEEQLPSMGDWETLQEATLEETVILPQSIGVEESGSISLSQWLEANGGQAAADLVWSQQLKEEAEQVMAANPSTQAQIRGASQRALDKCEGTSIGSIPSYGDVDVSDSDFSISFSVPFSVFGGLDWDQGQVSVGSRGVGVTTNGSVFWGGPSEIADCVNREIQDAVDMVAEEMQQLMEGDYSLIEDALIAVAVDYAIDEISDRSPEIGEMLDTLQSLCLSGSMKCF